jgi:hypothetical protein
MHSTKKLKLISLAVALVIGSQARATLYNINFTGGDGLTTAFGQVDVNSGIATSGFLDVTYNGTTIDYTTLAPAGVDIRDNTGTDFFGSDNAFNPNSITQGGFLTANGLIFYQGTWGAGGMVGLSDYSSTDPTPYLMVDGNPPAGWGYLHPSIDGHLSVTLDPVPEPTTMVAGALLLLPFGASALRMLRKSRTA